MTLQEPHLSAKPPRNGPLRVLVASGPTREAIDDVRFIGNRSSGAMGAAIVAAFADAGCPVTAALGPGAVAAEGAARTAKFGSAEELLVLLQKEWPQHDLLVMAAAVADFRPVRTAEGKLRRESGPMQLQLEPTQDILASLAPGTRANQYVVGFALERENELEQSAKAKLQRKRADAIVANPLETMDSPTVRGRVLLADGTWHAPGTSSCAAEGAEPTELTKQEFARWLCDLVMPLAVARKGRP